MPETLSEVMDNLFVHTLKHTRDGLADQIFDGHPFWMMLRKNGHLKAFEGGKYIQEDLRYAKSERTVFIGKGGTVALNETEFMTSSIWEWKYLVDSLVRFGVDDQMNRGKMAARNYVNDKIQLSKDSLANKMETSLFAASAETNGFTPLPVLIPNDPTASSTIGGINQANYSWWRNQTTDMTGLSFAVHGWSKMRNMLNKCQKNLGQDRPNMIATNQTIYELYEDSFDERQISSDRDLEDAGFMNVQFKKIPIIWSPSAPAQKMFFLNFNFLYFAYDPLRFFDMTNWKEIPDQPFDRAAQIMVAGNLITNRRRVHGVLHTIDTQ